MLDGIKLEQAGIPAVSIVTAPFMATGHAMAATWGVPEYKFLVTSHPIANLSNRELDAKADELVEQVVAFLARTQSFPFSKKESW